jgi:CPA2 family monovalent cation:H+ antiporter-2
VDNSDLFVDILLVTGAGFIGGYIAHSLRLPAVVGFLAAGIVIGPNTPGPAGDVDAVERVAELGVIFLMFGLGIQVSFRELIALRRIALVGGLAQVVLTCLTAWAAAPVLGLDWRGGVVLGFLVAISSTVVALKVLEARGETASLHAKAGVALLVFQDLAVVVMVLILPSLGGTGVDFGRLALALAKGGALILVAYLAATFVVPAVWRHIAFRRSRELSLLASLTLAIGLATGSGLLGLSVAFGAFLAGLAVSESEFGFQTLSDIYPLRDVFATVFFVAVGMLIAPRIIIEEPAVVVGVVLLAVAAKGAVTTLVLRGVGLPGATALRTGALMAQMGEFSFVLARAGLDHGLISEDVGSAFLFGAAATIVMSPLVTASAGPVVGALRRSGLFADFLAERPTPFGLDDVSVHRHVIIGGYGRTGRALARSLAGRRLPFVVVDSNPYVFDHARASGTPFVFGDIARPEILELCNVRDARMLAVTFADEPTARVAIINARLANPKIDVVVRGSGPESHGVLRSVGASEVVDAEFEASQEFVRHVLHRFGVDAREITALQATRRAEHYRQEGPL